MLILIITKLKRKERIDVFQCKHIIQGKMERKIDFTYDSTKGPQKYQLATGYISETSILLQKEGVIAVIQAKGSVELYDMDGQLLATANAPKEDEGRGVYEEVVLDVEGEQLKLTFPIYQWIDNYPNCDGEHDRWDTKKVGEYVIALDLTTGSICQ